MNTLTCEELRHYPGRTFTEQLQAHHEELATRPKRLALVGTDPNGAARSKPIHGPLAIGRRIDIRRFTGRDRIERVANYLRASVPRAESWSEEALRELATGLLAKAEIIE